MDRLTKAMVYAAAGVPEYWIVNVRAGQVEIHRDPDRRRVAAARSRSEGATDASHRWRFRI